MYLQTVDREGDEKEQGEKWEWKLNTDDEVLESKHDMSLSGLLSSKSKVMHSRWHRRLYRDGAKLQELYIWNHEDNWESNIQHGSMFDNNLSASLCKDENDRLKMNEEDRCFDLMLIIVHPLAFSASPERSDW